MGRCRGALAAWEVLEGGREQDCTAVFGRCMDEVGCGVVVKGQGTEVLDEVSFVGFRDCPGFTQVCSEDVVHFLGLTVDRRVVG